MSGLSVSKKLLFRVLHSAKASPYTGEVGEIYDFARRGCIQEVLIFT